MVLFDALCCHINESVHNLQERNAQARINILQLLIILATPELILAFNEDVPDSYESAQYYTLRIFYIKIRVYWVT